jgi:hypothetical protein
VINLNKSSLPYASSCVPVGAHGNPCAQPLGLRCVDIIMFLDLQMNNRHYCLFRSEKIFYGNRLPNHKESKIVDVKKTEATNSLGFPCPDRGPILSVLSFGLDKNAEN